MDNSTRIKQRINFYSLRGHFSKVYNALIHLGEEPFILPFWQEVNRKTAAELLPKPKINFLDLRTLKDTMVVEGSKEWLDAQTTYLHHILGNLYKKITKDDAIGGAPLLNTPNNHTSHNTLHHLYHIYFFKEQTQTELQSVQSVVEWGGGYGNFAKLWYRLSDRKTTYTIIDTSLFCAIQWLYLTSILGKHSVHLLQQKGDSIQPGKINIVPLALLNQTKIEGDLFVSTWGLSESSDKAQDYVVKSKWFGAKHLLIGFQDSIKELKYASRLGDLAKKDGAKIVDIDFIPHNHYALK